METKIHYLNVIICANKELKSKINLGLALFLTKSANLITP